MIKLGDRVKFINDVGVGKVVKIEGKIVTVDREDGFEVPALISELVVVPKEDELRAISRIGVSDPKPGRVRRNAEEQKAYRDQKKLSHSAMSKYGRITLTNEYEDDEDPIDIMAIKESYTRNMANVNSHLNQIADDEPLVNDTSIFDEPKTVVTEKDYDEVKITKEVIKESVKPKEEKKANTEKKKSDIEVVDLHASEILESEAGMKASDILNYQIDCFKAALDAKIGSKTKGKIIFIHGVGSGKLKYEITRTLRLDYPSLYYQDASFKEYGYGAIMVII